MIIDCSQTYVSRVIAGRLVDIPSDIEIVTGDITGFNLTRKGSVLRLVVSDHFLCAPNPDRAMQAVVDSVWRYLAAR